MPLDPLIKQIADQHGTEHVYVVLGDVPYQGVVLPTDMGDRPELAGCEMVILLEDVGRRGAIAADPRLTHFSAGSVLVKWGGDRHPTDGKRQMRLVDATTGEVAGDI